MREAERLGYSNRVKLIALFHDASEAYLSDLVTPVKRNIPQYKEIENVLMYKIWEFIGIIPTIEQFRLVDDIDKAVLKLEAKSMMTCNHWDLSDNYLDEKSINHIDLTEKPFLYFKNMFLSFALELLSTSKNNSLATEQIDFYYKKGIIERFVSYSE